MVFFSADLVRGGLVDGCGVVRDEELVILFILSEFIPS